jgi:hypothetical protein
VWLSGCLWTCLRADWRAVELLRRRATSRVQRRIMVRWHQWARESSRLKRAGALVIVHRNRTAARAVLNALARYAHARRQKRALQRAAAVHWTWRLLRVWRAWAVEHHANRMVPWPRAVS